MLKLNLEKDKDAVQFNEVISGQIKDLTKPMVDLFSITSFSYLRFFNDGRLLHIQPDLKLLKLLLENNFNHEGLKNPNLKKVVRDLKGSQQYCWPSSSRDPLSLLLGQHGIGNSMSVLSRKKTHLDSWTFSTTLDNSDVKTLYSNNKDIFSHFVAYFSEKFQNMYNPKEKGIYFDSSLYKYYYGEEKK